MTPMAAFQVPEHGRPIREKVTRFIEDRVYPAGPTIHAGGEEANALVRELQAQAKSEGLWALGTPRSSEAAGCPSSTRLRQRGAGPLRVRAGGTGDLLVAGLDHAP